MMTFASQPKKSISGGREGGSYSGLRVPSLFSIKIAMENYIFYLGNNEKVIMKSVLVRKKTQINISAG